MALAGADGKRAAELLRASVKRGAATLGTLTEDAVKRLLSDPGKARQAKRLFNDDERAQLADSLAATNGTAELLGRARIRKRLEQAKKTSADHHDFSEAATDFSCFDDSHPIHPLAPLKALSYFRRLIPGLNPDRDKFADSHRRQAFSLAATTDVTLLDRIKGIIASVLATGESVSDAPKAIARILDDAGVSPRNPQYAEMAFRTNMMDAYNEGSHAEMQDPDVRGHFPVWRYVGIRDGRQGKDHEPHFDKYYPNSANFSEVRGDRPFNCRCTSIPIYKSEWKRLQESGVRVSKFTEQFGVDKPRAAARFAETCDEPDGLLEVPNVPQPDAFSCGAASAMSVGRYFGVGPTDLDNWKQLLGTDPEKGTSPESIAATLTLLGLRVETRHEMSLEDLADCWQQGWPVIVPIQDYAPNIEPDDYDDGHYVVFIGGPSLGYVFVQDPMADVELADSNSDAAPGKVMIEEGRFEEVWHDESSDGEKFVRFGIVVKGH